MPYYVDAFMFGDGNPSKKGGGFTVFEDDRLLLEHRLYLPCFHLTTFITNNDLELLAVCCGIEKAPPYSTIFSDSQCALAWIRNGYSKARKDWNKTLRHFKILSEQKHLSLEFSPREQNFAGHYNDTVIHGKTVRYTV